MKTTIALAVITAISFSVFFVAANAVEKKEGDDSLVERVVKRYGEKLPQKEITKIGESPLFSDIDTLEIDSNSNDITFYSDAKEGKIEIYGTEKHTKSEFKKEGSKLKLSVSTDSGITWGFTFSNDNTMQNSGVRVYLPKTVKHVNLQTSSGDIKMTTSQIETLNISTSSGDVRTEDVTARTVNMTSSSGDFRLELTSENQNYTTSSGDISLKAKNCKNLSIVSSSGDQTISENCETSTITTSSGDISIKETQPSKSITVVSRSGDVSIRYETPKPSINVNFASSSGELHDSDLKEQITQKADDDHYWVNKGESILNITTSSGDLTLAIDQKNN